MIPTLEWTDAGVRFLDQTKLPLEETYVLAEDYRAVADVIRTMIVRGAPAIGVSAAMGVALGLVRSDATDMPQLDHDLNIICETIAATRPTAVNLFWGIERIRQLVRVLSQEPCTTIPQIQQAAVAEARRM